MDTPTPTDLRAGMRISQASFAWSATVCTAAVVVGSINGSLVLVAFGLTGLLDGAGSLALVLHFRHALAHNVVSSRRERVALRIVSVGLMVVGVATAVESARRIAAHTAGHGSPLGIGLTALSVLVLAALSVAKWRIAQTVGSDALRADGWLSATGAALALIAVTGTALSSESSPTWADPVAALCVACIAAVIGALELRREARTI